MPSEADRQEFERLVTQAGILPVRVIEMPKLADYLSPLIPRAATAFRNFDDAMEVWRKSIQFGETTTGVSLQEGVAEPAPETPEATLQYHTLLDANLHTDTVLHPPVQGDLVVANATPRWDALAIGPDGYFLRSNGADPGWEQINVDDIHDPEALTAISDTNVTITLGGSPAVALLAATSITLGWTGVLSLARGGTNKALTAVAGAVVWCDADSFELTAAGTTGQILVAQGTSSPIWQDASTAVAHKLLSATHTDTVAADVVAGDLVYGSATPKWERFPHSGEPDDVLHTTSATAIAWGRIDINNSTTGTLVVSRGGTGLDAWDPYAVVCGGTTATNPLQQVSGLGTSGMVLTSNGTGTLPTWQSLPSTAHTILNATAHTDSVTQTVSVGSLIYGNATPKWDELVIGSTGTFLRSNGTVPSWQTVAATDISSPAALTKTDDTNVTLTLGGSPTVALLAATSLTLGWTGVLSLARGGTNKNITAVAGAMVWCDADSFELTAAGTTGQLLVSNGTSAPTWQSAATATAHNLLSATHSDTTPAAVTQGALIVGDATPKWVSLAAASVGGKFIRATGALNVAWSTLVFINASARGDLLKGSSTANTIDVLAIGASGRFLKSDGSDPSWAVITAADVTSGAALTKTDDTNVTLTLGGSPTTALLAATSLTLGWTGVLALSRGGTNKNITAVAGAVVWCDADSLELTAAGSSGQILVSQGTSSPIWQAAATATAHALLSATHTDTTAAAVARGAIVTGQGASPTWSRLTIDAAGKILRSDGTDLLYSTFTIPDTFAQGDVVYSSSANTLAGLAKDTNATRYLSNTGTSNNPAWAQVNLSNGVTSTLPVANGGTGAVTFTAYAVICAGTTATGAFQNVSGLGTAGQVLTSNGAGALPTWQDAAGSASTLLNATAHTDTVTQTVSRGSLIYGNATPKWDELVIGSANRVLRSDGTDASWSLLDLSTDTTGVLSVAHGGTNTDTLSEGAVLFGGLDGLVVGYDGNYLFFDNFNKRFGVGTSSPTHLFTVSALATGDYIATITQLDFGGGLAVAVPTGCEYQILTCARDSAAGSIVFQVLETSVVNCEAQLFFPTDITWDIGQAGANRPRDVFIGQHLSVFGNTFLYENFNTVAEDLPMFTGSVDDYALPDGSFFRLDFDAGGYTMTGIANGTNGRRIVLANVSTDFTLTIANLSGSSGATNQIITGTEADITLEKYHVIEMIYDGTSEKWRCFPIGYGGAGPGGTHNLLDGDVHPDTVAGSPVFGDLVFANSDPAWDRLAIGAGSTVLTSDGSQPIWAQVDLTSMVTGVLPVANGGTAASSWTAGSVIFAGASGTSLAQDNANFFWDDSNNRLGIGHTAPTVKLHVKASGNEQLRVESTSGDVFLTIKANGTADSGFFYQRSSTGRAGFTGHVAFTCERYGGSTPVFYVDTSSAGAGGSGFGGITSPTAKVHCAAGSTSASTAPMKWTSGSLMSSAEVGAFEFLTDKIYFTITTSTARKEIALCDIALTSGRGVFTTTNGRLTDSSTWTYSTTAGMVIAPSAASSGVNNLLVLTGAAHTAQTAANEVIDVDINLARTVQHASNNTVATQRAVAIKAPTHSFASATGTITTAVVLSVTAATTAGTNAVITSNFALQVGGAVNQGATAAGLIYRAIDVPAHTLTVTGTTGVTSVGPAMLGLAQLTVTDASSVTFDNAATLYIANAPVAAGSVTITNKYAIWSDAGVNRLDGSTGIGGVTAPTALLHLAAGTSSASTGPLKFTSGTNMSAAEAGAMEYNGTHYLTKSNAIRYPVGGTLFDHYADVGNVGAGEDDLYSDTIPANTLDVNGHKIFARYGLVIATSIAGTVRVRVYFGGTAIFDSTALLTGGETSRYMAIKVTIIREGSGTVRYACMATATGLATASFAQVGSVGSLTLSNTQILKITGEATNTDEIVAKVGTASFEPAA